MGFWMRRMPSGVALRLSSRGRVKALLHVEVGMEVA
jgi:hypothetical protein